MSNFLDKKTKKFLGVLILILAALSMDLLVSLIIMIETGTTFLVSFIIISAIFLFLFIYIAFVVLAIHWLKED